MKIIKKHSSKKYHSSQEGYISTDLKKIMSKNEKIVMGILIGGIVVFLILSIILIFGKGRQSELSQTIPTTSPSKRVNTTPYPTIPPIKDMTVMINKRRLNPESVTIKAGNKVSFLNIDTSALAIEGADSNSSFLNFTVASSDVREIQFTKPGKYIYRLKDKPSLVGTINIE